jgi:hemolysin D
MAESKSYDSGEYIFREGETGGFAYILVKGEVEIVKSTPGGTIILQEVGKGALFGEMAIIDEGIRSAGARARTDVDVTEINRVSFLNHISKKPQMALNLMSRLAVYVRDANQRSMSGMFTAGDAAQVPTSDNAPPPVQDEKKNYEEIIDDTDAIYDARPSGPAMLTGFLILLFIVSTVLFASFTFVDTTVTTRGKFTTKVPNIGVQATSNSVVQALLVERGQTVSEGEVVARLDGTYVHANLKVVSEKLSAVKLRILRMNSEQSLLNSGDDLSFDVPLDDINRDILSKRIDEYRSRMASFRARVQKIDQEVVSVDRLAQISRQQLKIKKQVEEARKSLFDKEIGSFLNYLQSKDARLASEKELAGTLDTLEKLKTDRVAAVAERQAFVAQWFAELAEQLAKEGEQKIQLTEEQVKLARQAEDLAVRSPVDAIILDLPTVSAGSIVREGEIILTLVRTNVSLALEIDVDPKDVSDLRLDAPVSVKLDALPFQQFGDLDGTLVFISEDTFPESLSGEKGSYYRGRVDVSLKGIDSLPAEFSLTPGMLATADLKVGKRRLGTYFTYPIIKNFSRAFREPD